MARRFSAPYQSEPVSSLASWARNLAVFSVVAVLVSIIIVRQGFLEMQPALATFFGALGCAVLSILVCLAAFVAIWQNGSRGMSRILLALLIDAVVLAYPAYLALQYRKLPPIHDVTTDPIDPPRFDIRSSSRYFESDLGSNATRITKLIDDINTAADNDNLKPVKKAQPPKA